jgi:hypothetical protein
VQQDHQGRQAHRIPPARQPKELTLAFGRIPRYGSCNGERDMKSRFLSDSEKRDVAAAAMEFLKSENPGCIVHVVVEDETDDRGVPRYQATITPLKHEPFRT